MDKKTIRSWIMYDWANSGFVTTIMTVIMPIYFARVAGQGLSANTATAYWGYTQSIALLIVLLISPVLGQIADTFQSKKKFLLFFTYMGVITSFLMCSIGQGQWLWASILVVVGTVAFSASNIFYDAFLTDIVPREHRDTTSIRGYAIGYFGGGTLLAINLAVIQFHDFFHLSHLMATKLAFISVGIWWFVFSIPLIRNVHEKKVERTEKAHLQLFNGFKGVYNTLRKMGKYPELLKFLIFFWFFSDGINTIIKMATIYGSQIGIGETDLILAILITQFIGVPCTLLFGKIARKIGSKPSLLITVVFYLMIVLLGYFMTTALHFYLLAIAVGFVQGGSQALSRSIYSRLVPVKQNAEFFGLYGLSGKLAASFGPALFAFTSQITGSSRFGIMSLGIFFLLAIVVLVTTNIQKGEDQAVE